MQDDWCFSWMEDNCDYEKEQKLIGGELMPSTSLKIDQDSVNSELVAESFQTKRGRKKNIEGFFKIYECDQCSYKCKQNSNIFHSSTLNSATDSKGLKQKLFSGVLERHKWVHRKEREFICDYCGKAFKSRDYITNHIKRHFSKSFYQLKALFI